MIVSVPAAGYILHERAAEFYGAGAGWLSIKSFYAGQALYSVGPARFAVADGAYLVLNHGREYGVSIEAGAPVESFCVFFAPGFAEAVRRGLATPAERLLSDPAGPGAADVHFFERTYPRGDAPGLALQPMRRALVHGYAEHGWLEEQLHELMRALLHQHHTIYREAEQLPAARAATREELYRRLHLARELAAAMFHTPLTLGALAGVAGMSPNHLLRTFKQAFGQTPHQYITGLRLAAARQRLAHTDEPISAICLDVGFESLGAFSWLFRRHVGMPPREYRRRSR